MKTIPSLCVSLNYSQVSIPVKLMLYLKKYCLSPECVAYNNIYSALQTVGIYGKHTRLAVHIGSRPTH